MKKAVAMLAVMCMVICFCVPVCAETGGAFYFEKAKMHMEIPQEWVVFTRNTPRDDEDIEKHFKDYNEMIEMMEEEEWYLIMYLDSDYIAGIDMWPAYQMVDSFRVLLEQETDEGRQKHLAEVDKESRFADYTNKQFFQNNPGAENNYHFLQVDEVMDNLVFREYMVIANGQAVTIFIGAPGKEALDEGDIAVMEELMQGVQFENGVVANMPEAKAANATEGSTSQNIVLWGWIMVLGLGAVAVALVWGMVRLKRKKWYNVQRRSDKMRVDKKKQTNQPTTQYVSARGDVIKKENILCARCGKSIPADSVRCVRCGMKVEEMQDK